MRSRRTSTRPSPAPPLGPSRILDFLLRRARWLGWAFAAGLLLGLGAPLAVDLYGLLRRPPCLVGLLILVAACLVVYRRAPLSRLLSR